jgi:hypothetical protein
MGEEVWIDAADPRKPISGHFGFAAQAFELAARAAWISPLASERQVLTFHTRAWLRFAPPTCRMPFGQVPGSPRTDPGGRVTPRFRHRLISFRHFIDGLLALASLNRACRDHAPAFPQCSPLSLLTSAACGGLRPVLDHRPRRVSRPLEFHHRPLAEPSVRLSPHSAPIRRTRRSYLPASERRDAG